MGLLIRLVPPPAPKRSRFLFIYEKSNLWDWNYARHNVGCMQLSKEDF